jgi:transposase
MRWIEARVFESMVHDLRVIIRIAQGRGNVVPTAAIIDSRTLQSTPESGSRAGYDAAKRKRGSKVHAAVDIMGNLLALRVTPANEQDREQVANLAADMQEVTGQSVEVTFVDQAYTGEDTAKIAKDHGIQLLVVKKLEGIAGFVVLPKRWVVERTQGCLGRLRRLTRDFERLPTTLAGMHWLAALILMLRWSTIHIA